MSYIYMLVFNGFINVIHILFITCKVKNFMCYQQLITAEK